MRGSPGSITARMHDAPIAATGRIACCFSDHYHFKAIIHRSTGLSPAISLIRLRRTCEVDCSAFSNDHKTPCLWRKDPLHFPYIFNKDVLIFTTFGRNVPQLVKTFQWFTTPIQCLVKRNHANYGPTLQLLISI